MKTIKGLIKSGILAIALLVTATLSAQEQQYWIAGPKAGASFSTLSNVENPKMQGDFTAGAFAVYSRWAHFGFSSDLLYTRKTSKYDTEVMFGDATSMVTVNPTLEYIEMPILANYFFLKPKSVIRPKIVLGPSLGFLVSKQGDNPLFKTFDVGAVGGIGANIRLAQSIWLNVDGRYNHGFLDATEADGDVMNRNVTATVGVGFGLGK